MVEALDTKVQQDGNWISFSALDKEMYTKLLTGVTLASSLVTHPLFVMTTRMQVGLETTERRAFQTILQHTGWRGLFRGWVPLTAGLIPSEVVYLSTTEASREYLQAQFRTHLPGVSNITKDTIQSFITGTIANLLANIFIVPGEVVSTRIQVQPPGINLGIRGMLKTIYKEGGIRGLYKGGLASLYVNVLYSTGFWSSYSFNRRELSKVDFLTRQPWRMDAIAGCLSGLVATVAMYPIDTVKTRVMTGTTNSNSKYLVHCMLDTVRREGPLALWKGFKASAVQACLVASAFTVVYEYIKRTASVELDEDF